jgi:CDGSH-type Zn-finger protein
MDKEAKMARIAIRACENGPYVIEGSASYRDATGERKSSAGAAVALCRCARTQTNPFCDGTHRSVSFRASETLVELETE